MMLEESRPTVQATVDRPSLPTRESAMSEPEIHFSQRLRGNPWRIAAFIGVFLAVVAGAAVTMGASPAASPSTSGTGTGAAAVAVTSDDSGSALDRHGRFGGSGFGAITITAIDGSNISLETEDGWTRTITITSATTITKEGEAIDADELAVGDQIRFRQTRATDGTFSITAINVVLPKVAGTVTAVTADTITITTRDGTSRTITTTGSTTYRLGGADGTRADVVVGSTIVAAGTEGSGDAFTATTVAVKAPRVGGTVTAVSGSTITIETRDGSSETINVDADTIFTVAGVEDADIGDVAVGMRLIAVGRRAADGSLDATAVRAGAFGLRGGGPWKHDGTWEPAP
jgi:hypothetical protein